MSRLLLSRSVVAAGLKLCTSPPSDSLTPGAGAAQHALIPQVIPQGACPGLPQGLSLVKGPDITSPQLSEVPGVSLESGGPATSLGSYRSLVSYRWLSSMNVLLQAVLHISSL